MKSSLLLCAFLASQVVFAQLPGWTYKQAIGIQENLGVASSDFQIELTVNTQSLVTSGFMLASGNDIRFTDSCTGGTNFSYWIESGMNTTDTKIWVHLDTLAANATKVVYMHYGNSMAAPASAILGTFIGPHSATDLNMGGVNGGSPNTQRGYRFSAAEDLLVTSLGRREPNGTTRYITLFDFNTQAIVTQMQIGGAANTYSYAPLPAPMWMTPGTEYVLQQFQDAGDNYYYISSNQQLNAALNFVEMRYCNSCTQNTFPSNTLAQTLYGIPDMEFYTKNELSIMPTIVFDPQLTLSLVSTASLCWGDTAIVAMNPDNGQGPYTTLWTGDSISNPTNQFLEANPTQSQTYYVSVTDACGNSTLDSVEMIVNPLPVVSIASSDPLVCAGEFAELSVSDSTLVYLWSDGTTTNDTLVVMPFSTTLYSVTVTDSNACMFTAEIQQEVNVPILATQNVTLCANAIYTFNGNSYSADGIYVDTLVGITNCDSIVTTNLTFEAPVDTSVALVGTTLKATPSADGYQWIDCATGNPISGETSADFPLVASGYYAVVVTVGSCSDTSACFDASWLGVEVADLVENVKVYPNPSQGVFKITSSISQDVQFVDASGKLLELVALEAGKEQTVHFEKYDSGLYFIVSRTKVVRVVLD